MGLHADRIWPPRHPGQALNWDPQPQAGTRSMPDAVWMLVDHIDR
jgi:hypothetical protein